MKKSIVQQLFEKVKELTGEENLVLLTAETHFAIAIRVDHSLHEAFDSIVYRSRSQTEFYLRGIINGICYERRTQKDNSSI